MLKMKIQLFASESTIDVFLRGAACIDIYFKDGHGA